MNQSLVERWKSAQTPFAENTISLCEAISISDLLKSIALIVDELCKSCGSEQLNKIEDWHEHDGYINNAKVSSWDELKSFTVSPDALAKAYIDESYVSLGFFPQNHQFYFRIHILEPDDYLNGPPSKGNFDLSCKSETSDLVTKLLSEKGFCISTEPAKQFFDRRDHA